MKKPPPAKPIVWTRADPAALAAFDPATKVCTMNCGPALGDPRSAEERKLLCDECVDAVPQYRCLYCGAPSRVDPADQRPPPDYCHEGDHT